MSNHPLIDDFHYLKDNIYNRFLHEHDGYEIFYIHSGGCNYYYGTDYDTLEAGDLLIVRSNVLHGPSMNELCIRTNIWFTEPCIQSIGMDSILVDIMKPFRGLKFGYKLSLQHEQKTEFEETLARLNKANQLGDAISIERFRLILLELMLLIYQLHQEIPIQQPTKVNKNEQYVSQILTFVDQHFNEEISYDDLGKVTHLSKSHLMKVFKESLGISISEYINRRRVYEAKRMLLSTNEVSITEIAYQVGFKQLSHFSASFKKITGHSPEKFRRTTRIS